MLGLPGFGCQVNAALLTASPERDWPGHNSFLNRWMTIFLGWIQQLVGFSERILLELTGLLHS